MHAVREAVKERTKCLACCRLVTLRAHLQLFQNEITVGLNILDAYPESLLTLHRIYGVELIPCCRIDGTQLTDWCHDNPLSGQRGKCPATMTSKGDENLVVSVELTQEAH